MAATSTAKTGQPVIRALRPGIQLRAAEDGGMPTLHGHFAVWNRWAEIDSWFEGHFMERIAPGAFKKTFRELTPKVLFQHGQDPQIGDKPLGAIESLAEDAEGAAYEVPLLDTAYNRELIPGLEAGLYGASFRFSVMREETVDEPEPHPANPHGLPERTIKEAKVMEFGPVTFPAYAEASAGVRSLTDRFLFDAIERDPERARELLTAQQADLLSRVTDEEAGQPSGRTLPPTTPPETRTPTPTGGRRAPAGTSTGPERREPPRFRTEEEWFKWLTPNGT